MAGLVDQLQTDALDRNVPLTTLLRKVKMAAVKLKLQDAVGWVEAELNGYEARPPEYRIVSGQLKWWNPYHGWLPVGFGDSATANHFQTWPVPEAVGSLEATLASDMATYHLPMPADVSALLSESAGIPVTRTVLDVPRGALVGIVDRVRGLVLDWALELEGAGITGEGLSFSSREQEVARSASISIGTFHGNFSSGELSGTNARLNQGGTDNSTNIIADRSVFGEIETAVNAGVEDSAERDHIIQEIHRLRDAVDPTAKLAAYQRLIAAAANHMTILAPFLPALGWWISG